MKHDRSIIDTYGGRWPAIADAVKTDAVSIALTGRAPLLPRATAECDELARRREALGLGMKEFARRVRLSYSAVYAVEVGTAGAQALQRYRAALTKLEES
jgi:hypothetical protein